MGTRRLPDPSTSIIARLLVAATLAASLSQTADARSVLAPPPNAPRSWRPLAPEPHPYTTEPGTFQLELDPLHYATNRHRRERTHSFEVPVRLKFGVTHNVDVQVAADAFVWEQTEDRDTGVTDRSRGLGDIYLASKINLIGNDAHAERGRAVSVMPTLRLPTRRHGLTSRGVEGGVKVPLAFEPVTGWEVEATPQFFADRVSDESGYHFRFTHLVVVNREIVEPVTAFVEFEQTHRTEPGTGPETLLGGGLTFDISERFVVEWGAMFGLTRAADDFMTRITLVQRF